MELASRQKDKQAYDYGSEEELRESLEEEVGVHSVQIGLDGCSFVLVEDDECGDDTRHPAAKGEQEDNEHGTAAAVVHREGWEDDVEDYTEAGHGRLLFYSLYFFNNLFICRQPLNIVQFFFAKPSGGLMFLQC